MAVSCLMVDVSSGSVISKVGSASLSGADGWVLSELSARRLLNLNVCFGGGGGSDTSSGSKAGAGVWGS